MSPDIKINAKIQPAKKKSLGLTLDCWFNHPSPMYIAIACVKVMKRFFNLPIYQSIHRRLSCIIVIRMFWDLKWAVFNSGTMVNLVYYKHIDVLSKE